jgi:hypothetical protein
MIYRLFYKQKTCTKLYISYIRSIKMYECAEKYALQANCKVYKIRRILITKTYGGNLKYDVRIVCA